MVLAQLFNIRNDLAFIELFYYVSDFDPFPNDHFVDHYAKTRSQIKVFIYNRQRKEFSDKLKKLQMSWINPRFAVEKVVIFGGFHEYGIVEVGHSLGHIRVSILSHSPSVPTLQVSFLVLEFDRKS